MNMEQVKEERFVFNVEWFDKQADLIRNYLLTFYPSDNSIDMVSLPSPTTNTWNHYNIDRGFLCSMIWKTLASSSRESPSQALVKHSFMSDRSSQSMQDSSRLLTMVIPSLARSLQEAKKHSSLWSNLMLTCTLVKLSTLSTKTVSSFQKWKWADLIQLQLADFWAQKQALTGSTCKAMFALEWKSLPMVQFKNGMTCAVLRTPFRPRSMHLRHCVPHMVLMVSKMLSMVVLTISRNQRRWTYFSLANWKHQPCSQTTPALSSNPTPSSLAMPVSLLTISFPKALRFPPCKCSTSTGPLQRNFLKFTRAYSPSSFQWLSKWLQVPASWWRSVKKMPWRPSVIWLGQWILKSPKICAQILSEPAMVWIDAKMRFTAQICQKMALLNASISSRSNKMSEWM